LIAIATSGKERLYNLASGINVSNDQLAETLRRMTGCAVEYSQPAPSIIFPRIDISRLRAEFDLPTSRVLDDLPQLIESYRRNLESPHDQS
jgi:nucleoside-diphosphate-sugar epimerase